MVITFLSFKNKIIVTVILVSKLRLNRTSTLMSYNFWYLLINGKFMKVAISKSTPG